MTSGLSILDARQGVVPDARDQAVHDLRVDGRGTAAIRRMAAFAIENDQKLVDVSQLLGDVVVAHSGVDCHQELERLLSSIRVGESERILLKERLEGGKPGKQLEVCGHD